MVGYQEDLVKPEPILWICLTDAGSLTATSLGAMRTIEPVDVALAKAQTTTLEAHHSACEERRRSGAAVLLGFGSSMATR